MNEEQCLKRAACLIASQLPEDSAAAMKVLDYAKGIVRHLDSSSAAGTGAVIPLSWPRTGLAVVQADDQAGLNGCQGKASPR